MTEALLKGIGLGLMLAMTLGPSFFALLQTSIKNGLGSGITLAFGIFTSDVFYVAVAYLGATSLLSDAQNKFYIEIAGGILLVVFGAIALLQKKEIKDSVDVKQEKRSVTFVKGFLLNTFNPAVFFLWFLWMSIVSTEFKFSYIDIVTCFCAALGTILLTDILKVVIANQLRNIMTPTVQQWASRILGIILITIGVNLMCQDCLLHLFFTLIGK
ncbi:MAG: LysE family transporter [Bacteroidetes bacterium]|nr:LysE family transporter [Bacteroidota bacterium]